jgi:hypothetical protein
MAETKTLWIVAKLREGCPAGFYSVEVRETPKTFRVIEGDAGQAFRWGTVFQKAQMREAGVSLDPGEALELYVTDVIAKIADGRRIAELYEKRLEEAEALEIPTE